MTTSHFSSSTFCIFQSSVHSEYYKNFASHIFDPYMPIDLSGSSGPSLFPPQNFPPNFLFIHLEPNTAVNNSHFNIFSHSQPKLMKCRIFAKTILLIETNLFDEMRSTCKLLYIDKNLSTTRKLLNLHGIWSSPILFSKVPLNQLILLFVGT